jgi:hypothetical protein
VASGEFVFTTRFTYRACFPFQTFRHHRRTVHFFHSAHEFRLRDEMVPLTDPPFPVVRYEFGFWNNLSKTVLIILALHRMI